MHDLKARTRHRRSESCCGKRGASCDWDDSFTDTRRGRKSGIPRALRKIMSGRTEREALAELQRLKASYQNNVRRNYEHAASDCRTCPTRGQCCTDAHFVNVHITRLEAVAIRRTIEHTPRLSQDEKRDVYRRARLSVERYILRASGDTFRQTFACPLYDPKHGCLVHRRAKPAPCIQHACYENWEDLPPTLCSNAPSIGLNN